MYESVCKRSQLRAVSPAQRASHTTQHNESDCERIAASSTDVRASNSHQLLPHTGSCTHDEPSFPHRHRHQQQHRGLSGLRSSRSSMFSYPHSHTYTHASLRGKLLVENICKNHNLVAHTPREEITRRVTRDEFKVFTSAHEDVLVYLSAN